MTTPPAPIQKRPDPLEEDVLRALRPVFAPADAFRKRIGQGIDAVDERERARAERLKSAPPRLQVAAGLLPPGLLPSGLVLVAGKKLSAKGLAAVVATPALSFVMVLLTLVAGLRALWQARQAQSAPDEQSGRTERADKQNALVSAWWKRNKSAALLSVAVIALLALLGHPETVLFCILLSTGVAALLLGEFARAGISDVKSVGRWTSGLLWNLGLYGFMLRQLMHVGAGLSNVYTACALLMIGALLCRIASGQLTWRSMLDTLDAPVQRLSHRDLPTVICLRGLMGLLTLFILAGVSLLLLALAYGFVSTKPSRERLVEYASGFNAPVQEVLRWEEFERVMDLLESDGGGMPDLELAAQVVQRAIEEEQNFGGAMERSAIRFGLVEDEDLPRWTESSNAEFLTGTAIKSLNRNVHSATLGALVRAGAIDENTRAGLGERIETEWPAPDAPRVLAELRDRIELLELLGEESRIESHLEEIRSAISVTWPPTHGGWRPTTAFLWDKESASGGLISLAGPTMNSSLWKPTDDALSLAAHAGIPEGVDLTLLRKSLARNLQLDRFGQLFGLNGSDDVGIELAAMRLERLVPDPAKGSWTAALVELRLLLAVLGLITLCVLASARRDKTEAVS